MGRFVNADALVSTGRGILGNNMFAYCGNNPANYQDRTGTRAQVCIDDEQNVMKMPWSDGNIGGKSAYSLIIYPANPNPWITPIVLKIARKIAKNEYVHNGLAINQIRSGCFNIKKGIIITLIPDPIPYVDEAKALTHIGYGLVQIISGALKLWDVEMA